MVNTRLKNMPWKAILLRGLLSWSLSALVLCLFGSGFLCWGMIPYRALGVLCSVISFLAAFAAGVTIAKQNCGLIGGIGFCLFLLVLLLTLGWLISDMPLSSSGVLSVVTFTAAGCLLGLVLPVKETAGKKGNRSKNKRRFKLRVI